MNKKHFAIIVILIISFYGCSKKEGISFCEGVDAEGKGVNCGKVFTTGDLTAVISVKEPFEADTLTVQIHKFDGNKKILEKKIIIDVNREKNTANTTLQFYNGGKYAVDAFKGESKIAEGEIEVRDIY